MSWEPINLAKLPERDPASPTLGGVGLIYPGKRHVFSGAFESAKTLAAYAIAIEHVREGGTVLLLDYEMGQWDARERLRDMGATELDFERIAYVEPETPANPDTIPTLIEACAPTLAVIDAAVGAYGLQGLDDGKRVDVERWAGLYVWNFWKRDIASITLDHVTKSKESRGAYAMGSERKIGGADVHLGFEVAVPLAGARVAATTSSRTVTGPAV